MTLSENQLVHHRLQSGPYRRQQSGLSDVGDFFSTLVTGFRSWSNSSDAKTDIHISNGSSKHLVSNILHQHYFSAAILPYRYLDGIYSKKILAEISIFALILCAIYQNEVIPILEIRHENSRFVLEKWHDGGVMMDEIEGGGGAVVYD